MAQDYDKIFRENFEELIQSLASKVLKVDPALLEEIPDDNQYTIEKRPDFLKKVKPAKPASDYILHIEVQSTDPRTMICRMLLYYAFLYKDYQLEVKQYVLYIGNKKKAKMPSIIIHESLLYYYNVINIQNIDHRDFLNSDRPEDVVIAILCNFKGKKADTIITQIIQRIHQLSKDELDLGKYLKQLEVLSKLRKLQEVTTKKIDTMAIQYDLKTDVRYLQGEKSGIEIGEKNGIAIGGVKALKMLQFSNEEISAKLNIPLAKVIQLIREIDAES